MRHFLHQTYVATHMALRLQVRDLGLLIGFLIVLPLGFLFFLGAIAQPAQQTQVVVGSIIFQMGLLNINILAQSIGNDKQTRIYDLWVSLPMNPSVYVASTALSVLPVALVSAGATLAVGVWHFGLPISWTILPAILIAFLLVWGSTLGVGFLIGVYGRSPRQIGQLAQVVGILLTFFAPVFYPITVLPAFLQYLAYAIPITWGSLLLAAILGTGSVSAIVCAGVLVGFIAVWLVLIAAGLRWRQP